jgi:hypothetical protein|tara:strand:+ start:203 stop:586 length:384 start_codon:yes stop_codon:yes gene_type:complete
MASILRVNTLTDASSNNSTAMSTVFNGTAKAWINMDGTGTISNRDSYNISGITDGGTGVYTVTISNDMSSANWSPTFTGGPHSSNNNRNTASVYSLAAGSVNVGTWGSGGSSEDYALVSLHINGDLA